MPPEQFEKSPLVSIGVPVFNGMPELAESLDSLLTQNYSNIEILISDNASTDGTEAYCRQSAQRESRVRYFRNDANDGPVANFQNALQRARGEYFMWAAHDDTFNSQYVATLVDELESHDDAVLAAGETTFIEASGVAASEPADRAAGHGTNIANLQRLLHDHATAWIYGLYRTAWLRKHVHEFNRYPLWGGDLLWLASVVLRFDVVGNQRAVIRKRLKPSAAAPATAGSKAWFRVEMLCGLLLLSLRHAHGVRNKLAAIRATAAWYARMFSRRQSRMRSLYRLVRLAICDGLLSIPFASSRVVRRLTSRSMQPTTKAGT